MLSFSIIDLGFSIFCDLVSISIFSFFLKLISLINAPYRLLITSPPLCSAFSGVDNFFFYFSVFYSVKLGRMLLGFSPYKLSNRFIWDVVCLINDWRWSGIEKEGISFALLKKLFCSIWFVTTISYNRCLSF